MNNTSALTEVLSLKQKLGTTAPFQNPNPRVFSRTRSRFMLAVM